MVYCHNCGANLDTDPNFCPNCGAALNGANTQNEDAQVENIQNTNQQWTRTAKTVGAVAGVAVGASMLGGLLHRRRRRPPMHHHGGHMGRHRGHGGPMGGGPMGGPGGPR